MFLIGLSLKLDFNLCRDPLLSSFTFEFASASFELLEESWMTKMGVPGY